jgi:hypothetical protein
VTEFWNDCSTVRFVPSFEDQVGTSEKAGFWKGRWNDVWNLSSSLQKDGADESEIAIDREPRMQDLDGVELRFGFAEIIFFRPRSDVVKDGRQRLSITEEKSRNRNGCSVVLEVDVEDVCMSQVEFRIIRLVGG